MSPAGVILAGLIVGYRVLISPVLPGSCRFEPTCSAYALAAVRRFGALRGGTIAVRRLSRCHPWGGFGFDPVPDHDGDAARGPRGGVESRCPSTCLRK